MPARPRFPILATAWCVRRTMQAFGSSRSRERRRRSRRLSIAGLPTDRFVFEGFLPPEDNRATRRPRTPGARGAHNRFFRGGAPPRRNARRYGCRFGGDRVAGSRARDHQDIRRDRSRHARRTADRFTEQAALGEVTLVVEGARRRRGRGSCVKTWTNCAQSRSCAKRGLSLKQAAAAVGQANRPEPARNLPKHDPRPPPDRMIAKIQSGQDDPSLLSPQAGGRTPSRRRPVAQALPSARSGRPTASRSSASDCSSAPPISAASA